MTKCCEISGTLTWLKHYARSVLWKHSGWTLLNGEVMAFGFLFKFMIIDVYETSLLP